MFWDEWRINIPSLTPKGTWVDANTEYAIIYSKYTIIKVFWKTKILSFDSFCIAGMICSCHKFFKWIRQYHFLSSFEMIPLSPFFVLYSHIHTWSYDSYVSLYPYTVPNHTWKGCLKQTEAMRYTCYGETWLENKCQYFAWKLPAWDRLPQHIAFI